jgi:aminopeptidase N
MLGFLVAMTLAMQVSSDSPGRGISETLARERAAAIRDLRYALSFVIPADRRAPVQGRVLIRFTLAAPHRIVLDFAQPGDHVRSVRVAEADTPFTVKDGHLVIPATSTAAGENSIAIEFVAGDESLNRNDDFLYTLFVPARAHLAFPVFDQPNLKAKYTLSLEVPDGWQTVSNGAEIFRLKPEATSNREATSPRDATSPREATGSREATSQREAAGTPGMTSTPAATSGRVTVQFAETPPLPTYLFSFAAGKFSVETAVRNGRELRMFHRETDAARLMRNRDAMFDLHASALAWLEEYTGIPYPWGKFDFVLIPAFQFSGMEHAGAILYNSTLLLDESATQQQLLDRASTIAHETAHMWFGNLVTMEWFSDVWMKEVFANFMAAKIVNPSFPQLNHDLRFLLAHHPAAYQIDRTAGANPIRQPLANLAAAGQLYGAIIYQKAPVVMRQLELMLGEQAFRDGLRHYLTQHAYGNATWLDLVKILDARSSEDVAAWSRAWVEEQGRPEFRTELRTGVNGITMLTLAQSDPLRRGLVWPQRLRITVGYAASEQVPVTVNGPSTNVQGAVGKPAPLYVLPSGGGLGYGLFVLDAASRAYLLAHLEDIPDTMTRGDAWVTLWENMAEGFIAPRAFIELAARALRRETDEQVRQRALSYLTRAFWRFLPQEERVKRAAALESMLRAGIAAAATSSEKSAWFNAYRDITLSQQGVAWLERIWKREEKIPGLTFAETDEIAMALELAVRQVPAWDAILKQQLERTQNPDRKARLAFVMPALSAEPAVREQAFERFRRLENRRREPWVVESLAYLNHPLREQHARRFVGPALELLREIQQTGDIFFPTRWTEATLSGHRSRAIAATVQTFLAKELQYPQRLRWTVLSAADDLLRASVP